VTGNALTGTLEPAFAMPDLDLFEAFDLAIMFAQFAYAKDFRKQVTHSIFDIDFLCVDKYIININKNTMMALTLMACQV
jgi:hypothetical protein